MVLKRDSIAWRAAIAWARRKHTKSAPVALSNDGLTVTMQGLLHGNTWRYTAADLRLLLMRRSRSGKVTNHPLFRNEEVRQ
jgi:uncharacterized membrane protein